MDVLCRRFGGFYVFASILENMAKGIAEGVIEVPKEPDPKSHGSNVHTLLPKLTVNKTFLQAFIHAPTPALRLAWLKNVNNPAGF